MISKIWEYAKSKKGAIGIGTLIVFIAMVLIAAVAANVLINVSGFLQQEAASTGRESTQQVASGIDVLKIQGQLNTGTEKIDKIAIFITPNAGSAPIDLGQTVVMLTDGKNEIMARYNNSKNAYAGIGELTFNNNAWDQTDNKHFGILVVQDADGSCQKDSPVINKGDIVAILVKTDTLDMGPRATIKGRIQPEFGAPALISFTTPSTYLDTEKIITLQ